MTDNTTPETSSAAPDTTPIPDAPTSLEVSNDPGDLTPTPSTPVLLPATDQKQITLGNVGVPTQVANPRRASWRTVVQSVIGVLVVAVPLVNVVLGQINDYLRQQTDVAVPGWVWVALNAGLAVTALAAGLISRIMNTPGVAGFIAKYLPFLAPIKQTNGEHEA